MGKQVGRKASSLGGLLVRKNSHKDAKKPSFTKLAILYRPLPDNRSDDHKPIYQYSIPDVTFLNTLKKGVKLLKRVSIKKFVLYLPKIVRSKQGILKTIGATLRELREEKGLLLREVGAQLSLDPTILSKIEQDKRMPTKEQAKALGEFYKHQKNDVIIAWLSDKLFYEVQDEDLALQAMRVAEEKIKYNIKNKKENNSDDRI